MREQKWALKNGVETRIITAASGQEAWAELARQIGVKTWYEGYAIPEPHRWSMYSVCPCGNTQPRKYCSRACYTKHEETDETSQIK